MGHCTQHNYGFLTLAWFYIMHSLIRTSANDTTFLPFPVWHSEGKANRIILEGVEWRLYRSMNRIIFFFSHMRWEKTTIISCHFFPLACHVLLWHKHADFHEVSNPGWIFWMDDKKKAYDAVIATSNLPWYGPTEKKSRKQSIQHRRLPL